MYYIEHMVFHDGVVKVKVYSQNVTSALIFRDYTLATPERPLVKDMPGRTVYVDARPTLLAALSRAQELAVDNGVSYELAADVRTEVRREQSKKGGYHRWQKK